MTHPPNRETLFCKHAADVLVRNGYIFDAKIAAYLDLLPDSGVFDDAVWEKMAHFIQGALTDTMHTDPVHAVAMFTAICVEVSEASSDKCWEMGYYLLENKVIYEMFEYAHGNSDAAYCLVTQLLFGDYHFHDQGLLSKAIETLTGQPLILSDDKKSWDTDILTALFGPVWSTLYATDSGTIDCLIEHVLVARPRFVHDTTVTSPPVATMPENIFN